MVIQPSPSPPMSKLNMLSKRRPSHRSTDSQSHSQQSHSRSSEESAFESSVSSPLTASTPSTPGSNYLEAASIAVESSVALDGFVLSSPDPGAKNGTPQGWLSKMGLLIGGIFAIPTMPFWALYYFACAPQGFNGVWGYLMCRGTTTVLAVTPVFPPVDSPKRRSRSIQVFGVRPLAKIVTTTNVTIPPVPTDTHPPLRPAVESIPLPGYMLSPPGGRVGTEPAAPGEKIILYFHGGGYIDGHPLAMPFAYKIALDTGVRLFASTYRKVLDPASAFPAPLVDAHTAWAYVISLGFSPSQIILMGDSAGGHLCLYLAQHLMVAAAVSAREHPNVDPAHQLPGALALCSPWVDLTLSFPSWKQIHDYLPARRVRMAARSALRHYAPTAARSAPLSPVFAPEGYWRPYANTPFFISYGANEGIADEAKALMAALRRDGVTVDAFEEPFGLHCGPITPWSLPSAYQGFLKGVKTVISNMD